MTVPKIAGQRHPGVSELGRIAPTSRSTCLPATGRSTSRMLSSPRNRRASRVPVTTPRRLRGETDRETSSPSGRWKWISAAWRDHRRIRIRRLVAAIACPTPISLGVDGAEPSRRLSIRAPTAIPRAAAPLPRMMTAVAVSCDEIAIPTAAPPAIGPPSTMALWCDRSLRSEETGALATNSSSWASGTTFTRVRVSKSICLPFAPLMGSGTG
jgi:hypothetical protein